MLLSLDRNYRRDAYRVLCVIVIFLLTSSAATATPLEEFRYRNTTVKFVDLRGVPVGNAYIYGYCRELHLVCPRVNPNDHQYDIPWKEKHLGKTGRDGKASFNIPPGKWAFLAAGTQGVRTIVVAWTDYGHLPASGQITLRPAVQKKWTFAASSWPELQHERFFIKPKHLPIYIPVTVPGPRTTFEISDSGVFELWGQASSSKTQPAFVINWGKVDTQSRKQSHRSAEELAEIDIAGMAVGSMARWYLPWEHGLHGEVNIRQTAKVLFSPGAYSLGYERPVARGILGDFVARRYELQPGQNCAWQFDTEFSAGADINTVKGGTYGCLYVVDQNGHLLRKLTQVDNDETIVVNCRVRVGTRGYQAKRKSEQGHRYFFVAADVQDQEQSWYFDIPITGVRETGYKPQPLKTVTSRCFSIAVPAVLEDVMANHLAQLDEYEDRVRELSGRTKHRRSITSLKTRVNTTGASATHGGQYIRIGAKIFYRDVPALWHDFCHELCHNFALVHGGMQELLVEAARCKGDDLISGQSSKWFLMNRMNGGPGKEHWYPHTGIYLYAYSRKGREFLRFASDNDLRLRRNMGKNGLSREDIVSGFISVALDKDTSAIGRSYGLCDSIQQHEKAVKAIKGFIPPSSYPETRGTSPKD